VVSNVASTGVSAFTILTAAPDVAFMSIVIAFVDIGADETIAFVPGNTIATKDAVFVGAVCIVGAVVGVVVAFV